MQRIINNNKFYKSIIINNNYKFFTTLNNNNNNNKNSNGSLDPKRINDMVEEIRKLDLLSELKKEDIQHGFSYEKGQLKQLMDIIEREILMEAEKQQKLSENEEDIYDKLMHDLKNRIKDREEQLKKEKRKSNILFYLLSTLLAIVCYQQYHLGLERIEKNKKEFDDKWENLRVYVNQRDDLKERKQLLINSISNELSKNLIDEKNIYSIDNDDIKYNVDSIINEYGIENKSPNEILSKSNKNLTNSKI